MATGDSTSTPLPGSTYRLVVSSAEEAVRLIHEKLGAEARVVSVKQIGGRGLASLLRAPQLEVIAEIPTPGAEVPAPPVPLEEPPAVAEPEPEPTFVIPAVATEDETAWLDEEPAPSSFSSPSPTPPIPFERLLTRAGLGEQTLARLRRTAHWSQLCDLPFGDALTEVVELLRSLWNETPEQPLGARVAFFGPPGSGTTTALCKALTIDTFFRQQPAVAMKLDGEQPNPTEGLAMFCEALQIPLIRLGDEIELVPEDHRLYWDATGFPLYDAPAWRHLGNILSDFYVDSRVLVLNAAYDLALLKRAYALGCEAGATHVVFTHLDEIQHWGKLWDLLLSGGLQPLFFSCGQNVSGELCENTFEMMAQHTLHAPAHKPPTGE